MKKSAILTLSILAAIILSINLYSCTGKEKKSESSTSSNLENNTETSVLEFPSYLTPDEVTDTEKVTEIKTEKEPETETETETKPKEKPLESLRFTSFGNGTCSVTGIGNNTDLFVVIPERSPDGDIVTSIDEKAFYGNKSVKAFEIPSTITSIGNMAFAGCSSLVYISVDKLNQMFIDIDGILYTKDRSTLLSYPASCGATELTISASVKKIADMAFFGCDGLKVIKYSGTLADWGKIEIGEMNYGLFTASVSCNTGK